MAIVNWPTALPECWQVEGFSDAMVPMAIQSEVDVGPPKFRLRYTRAMSDISAVMIGTVDVIRELRAFFINTLQGGAQPFTRPNDPVTGQTETYRFMAPPVFKPLTHERWRAELQLRRL